MNTIYKTLILVAILVFGFSNTTEASVAYSQAVTLSPGWNVISTPKILESHSFSTAETSENFDVLILDASKVSGWATMADLGQTTFVPLFGYFVNNKTGEEQTLTLDYKDNVCPESCFFEKPFSTGGWYSIGIANPTYAKSTTDFGSDTNNPSNILSLLGENYDSVIDFTNMKYTTNRNSVALSNPWKLAVSSDINTLNDFRETKGYAVYIKNSDAKYIGYQDDPVSPVPPEPATLAVSLNDNSPNTKEVIASDGADNDELDGLEILRFDVQAEGDVVTITSLAININQSGSTATTSTLYLFEGGTLIASQSGNVGNGGKVIFSDMDYVVSKDTTKVLTIKADIRDATSDATVFSVSINSSDIISKNSLNEILENESKSGSATGQSISVLNVGPEISLSSKSLTRDAGTIGLANGTSTASANFDVTIKAVGGDLWFGTQAASSTFQFGIHAGGADAATVLTASTTGYTVPSGVVTSGLAAGQAFKLAEGQTVTIPVTFFFEGRLASGALIATNSYAVGLSSVVWSDSQLGAESSSTFMANEPAWRTGGVTMP